MRDHSGFDSLSVGCGTSHIGTGSYTMMAIIAAETLVLPMAAEGGSWTFSSVGSAAQDACLAWRRRSFKLTRKIEDSPVADAHFDEVVFANGRISLRSNPAALVMLSSALAQSDGNSIEETGSVGANMLRPRCL